MTFLSFVRRLPRWAVVTWVALVVGVVGRVAWSGPNSGTVLPIYRNAGDRWLATADVYAPAPPHDVFRNPPGVAGFFAPWSLVPPKTAGVLWRLFGLAVYVTGLWAWVRRLPLDGVSGRQLGWFAVLAAVLVIPSFNNGQVNVLMVGSLLHAAAGVRDGRLGAAAVWVAVAGFFKIYPLAVGLLFCVIAPRLAWRLAVAVAVAAALPFAWQESGYVVQMHERFVEFLGLEGPFRAVLSRAPWDWTIVPRVWLGVQVPQDATRPVSAAAGLACAAVVAVARRRADAVAAAFAVGCVWMTLFGPATENATYTLLAPAAALPLLRRPRPAAVAAAVLLALPILRGLFPSSEVLPLRTAQPFAAVLLLGSVIADGLRPRRPAADGSSRLSPGIPSITSGGAGAI